MNWAIGILFFVVVIPNTINFKERNAFSDKKRLEEAKELYHHSKVKDSVVMVPGSYYDRGKIFHIFFGEKYRDLWTTPVKVKVLDYEKEKGGIIPDKFGGGDQTIGIEFETDGGPDYDARSVNKDQKPALFFLFKPTIMRFMFRDAVASANPYSHLIIPVLSEAIDIYHLNPELRLMPYNEKYGKYNERMAGRLIYFQEDLNSSWNDAERFDDPEDIIGDDEMYELREEEKVPFDSELYLKCRLFDILISDWDRHPGNWKWAYFDDEDNKILKPIPVDRDNAFYLFDQGLVSHISLLFSGKLKSFHREYGNMKGFLKQSYEQDTMILGDVPLSAYIDSAKALQRQLTDEVIREAFMQYPQKVYDQVGEEHEEILKSRLRKLPEAAKEFYYLVREDKNIPEDEKTSGKQKKAGSL